MIQLYSVKVVYNGGPARCLATVNSLADANKLRDYLDQQETHIYELMGRQDYEAEYGKVEYIIEHDGVRI